MPATFPPTQGPPGLPGASGAGTVQSTWTWLPGLESAPLQPGHAAADNAEPRAADMLYLAYTDDIGTDADQFISALAPGDFVLLRVIEDMTSWHRYRVTGPPQNLEGTYAIPVVTDVGSPPGTAPQRPTRVLVALQSEVQPGPEGPPGPQGEPGPPGPQGDAGPAAPNYVHTQSSPSTVWTVVHSLGKYVAVDVVDSGDSVVIPTVQYDSIDQVTLTFGSPTSGKAYAN